MQLASERMTSTDGTLIRMIDKYAINPITNIKKK